MGPRASLDGCGKSHPTGIRASDRPTRSESLYGLSYPGKLDLNLKKKLVKFYIWSIALYGAGTWTLWKVDQK